jgi:hypothetical protein
VRRTTTAPTPSSAMPSRVVLRRFWRRLPGGAGMWLDGHACRIPKNDAGGCRLNGGHPDVRRHERIRQHGLKIRGDSGEKRRCSAAPDSRRASCPDNKRRQEAPAAWSNGLETATASTAWGHRLGCHLGRRSVSRSMPGASAEHKLPPTSSTWRSSRNCSPRRVPPSRRSEPLTESGS